MTAPWIKVAEWRNLENNTGSALGNLSQGYHPGVQAWYNQFIAVDPANANHLFLGLEEVFESYDGGGDVEGRRSVLELRAAVLGERAR